MSIPRILRKSRLLPRFRELIKLHFGFPEIPIDKKKTSKKVPEKNEGKGEAGGAFDYLLRFHIEYINKGKRTDKSGWVAESSIERLHSQIFDQESEIIFDTEYFWEGKVISKETFYDKIIGEFEEAKSNYTSFIKSGQVTDKLLKSCLFLARLDVNSRAYILVENFGVYLEEEIKELEDLLKIVPNNLFRAKKQYLVNPYFPGFYSDGDLLIDDNLIDIKTVDTIQFKASYKYQLILYYIAHMTTGINGEKKKYKINYLSIYFARHGILHTMPITEIGDKKSFKFIQKWFTERWIGWERYK
ncbi:MAG TPA: hypothetical protein PLU73_02725 [Bacteroidia bacterium]|nr:hypothetical protein [Bacteroidia bacterium]